MLKKLQNREGSGWASQETLKVGFVPLVDCAPFVVARELGYFRRYGLRVLLSRELGWASIRDKVVFGELDAAQAVVGMPLTTSVGLGHAANPCCTGMVLNLHGNGITLSNDHWQKGATAEQCLMAAAEKVRGQRKLVFGTVSLVSSHYFLLRRWLSNAGLDADRDVEIAVVPPPQMPANLQAGNLDGYCAGEPWNSIAVHSGVGFLASTSASLDPGHPEKVLMVRDSFACEREDEHLRIIAALMDACAFCQDSENHEELARLLAQPIYVGASKSVIMRSLTGSLNLGHGRYVDQPDFHIFSAPGSHSPHDGVARWARRGLENAGLLSADVSDEILATIYRPEITDAAEALRTEAEGVAAS